VPYSNTAAANRTAPAEGLVTVDGRTFPLRSAAIKAKAQGGLAFTTLRQEFANPYAEPLEVLYTMPLPADGAVVGYTFRLGERVVRGRIETREKAQEDYVKALIGGKTAGLLEQERADTFTQTLGNLPPGSRVEVEIEVLHPLAFLPGVGGGAASWEWRFPTVVSVRYGGGADVAADRALPTEDGIPARFSAELVVGEGPWLVAEPQRLDRDFVFTWAATTADVEAHVVEGPGLPGDDGRYAMIVVTPPTAPAAVIPRDLTILLDASGSMDGLPLAQAKEVVQALLGSLREADAFELLAFSNTVTKLTPPSLANQAALAAAGRRLGELRAGGGTEMTRALEEVLAQEPRAETQRQVVLISDGYVGFEEQIGRMVRERLPVASRLHVVGIGAAAYSPAKYGILTELLPAEQLVIANGWIEGLTVASIVLGTLLGGLLIGPAISGVLLRIDLPFIETSINTAPEAAIVVIAAIYVIAALFNLAIPDTGARYPHQERNLVRLLSDFSRCFMTLWRDKLGQISLAVTTLFWGAGATLQFIVLKWAEKSLNLALSQASILQGISAVGVAIGAVLAARYVPLKRAVKTLPFGVGMGLVVLAMVFVHWMPLVYVLLIASGAMAGFFVVPMNALLQHRGHILMSAGHSIAVQNFNENVSILVMLALYSVMLRMDLHIHFIILMFGVFVAGTMFLVIRWNAANHKADPNLDRLIGEVKH